LEKGAVFTAAERALAVGGSARTDCLPAEALHQRLLPGVKQVSKQAE